MSAVYLFHRAMFARPRMQHDQTQPGITGGFGRPARLVFFDDLPGDNPLWLKQVPSQRGFAAVYDHKLKPAREYLGQSG